MWIRTWNGTPLTEGSYYGKSKVGFNILENNRQEDIGLPAPPAPASQYWLKAFKTDYLAAKPRTPSIGTIGEALRRVGDNLELTLTVPVSYSEGNPKIELGGSSTGNNFRVQISKVSGQFPADDVPQNGTTVIDTNGTFSLSGDYFTINTTYYLRARAYNWFGAGPWSAQIPYTTLGQAAGPGFAPVYNLGIQLTETPNTVTLTWSGIENGTDLYQSDRPNQEYASLQTNLQGATLADLTPEGTKFLRAIPAGRTPVGADNGNTPSETVGIYRGTFNKAAVGYGINAFVLPFSQVWGKNNKAIITAKDLIDEIRSQNDNTTAITYLGYWDATEQKPKGVILEYDNGSIKNTSGEYGTENLAQINLARGQGYQISVNDTINFTLVGKM
ncbi:MAG: hypothetical protein KJ732_00295 [Candidatus Margulisbacteria bacterium]|nr:hypothetical protein [Candidatus Margulisiibacteriota bacterium]